MMATGRFPSSCRDLPLLVLAALALLAAPASAVVVTNEFAVPTVDGAPNGITTGPDGNLWFTEYSGVRIGQLILSSAPVELMSFGVD